MIEPLTKFEEKVASAIWESVPVDSDNEPIDPTDKFITEYQLRAWRLLVHEVADIIKSNIQLELDYGRNI